MVSVSSAARRIFQLPENVLDVKYKEVFSADSDIVKMLTCCLEGQETKDVMIRLPMAKELRLLASTSILFDSRKNVVGAVLSCKDITLRIRLEEQMRRQERLASLGKLEAGVAHEIKNPLTSISGYIQFWQKSKAPTAQSLNTIYREVRRLDSIVNKLLFFTKPTNTVLVQVNINSFISKVLSFTALTLVNGQVTSAEPRVVQLKPGSLLSMGSKELSINAVTVISLFMIPIILMTIATVIELVQQHKEQEKRARLLRQIWQ